MDFVMCMEYRHKFIFDMYVCLFAFFFFFFQAEDGIRDHCVTGVQTCALPIYLFMACGHVLDNVHRYKSDVYYAEPKLMFRNTGHGIFENVSDQLGPDFQLRSEERRVGKECRCGWWEEHKIEQGELMVSTTREA